MTDLSVGASARFAGPARAGTARLARGLIPVAMLAAAVAGLSQPAGAAQPAAASTLQSTVIPKALASPAAIAYAGGNVYASDTGNNRVIELPAGGVETTVGITGLSGPEGLAVDAAGDVFVADTGNSRIVELPAGAAQHTVLLTGLKSPGGVAVDSAGDIFVADTGNNRVVELPKGGSQTVLGFSGLSGPVGIALDSAGDVYVADTGNNRIVELPVGGSQTVLGFTGLTAPQGVSVDSNLDVFVANTGGNSEIEKPSGGAQVVLGFNGVTSPRGIDVDPATDNVYLADTGNSRLLELSHTGAQTVLQPLGIGGGGGVALDSSGDVFASDVDSRSILEVPKGGSAVTLGITGLDSPMGIAADSSGDVFVADEVGDKIIELPKTGAQVTLGFSGLSSPTGVAVDAAGDVFVADGGNHRIVELPKGGSQVTIAFTGLQDPVAVALDSSGDLFVSNLVTSGGSSDVLERTTGGTQSTLAFSGLGIPDGLTVDSHGDVYVTDLEGADVVVLPKGGTEEKLAFTGLSSPDGVAVDSAGDVFVSDFNGPVVELAAVTLNGAPTIGTAVAGNDQATVSWFAPSTGGTVTGYQVTPYIAGVAQTVHSFTSTATTETITGLTNGDSYTFKVAATTSGGTSAQSGASNAVAVGSPSAPGYPSATSGNASAKVAWLAPASSNGGAVTGYTVTPYLGTTAEAAQTFNTTATSDTVTGLTNGDTYTFKVAAINADGTGVQSTPSAPVVIGLPGAPSLVSAVQGNATAKVSWLAAAANGSPITGYSVTPLVSGVAQTPQVFDTSTTNDTLSGLVNGDVYTFKVAGINASGTGASSTASAAIDEGAPAAPTALSATPGSTTAKVAWTAPAANGSAITGYKITPYVAGVAGTTQTFSTNAASDTVTGLTNGTSYTFKVVALNADGTGTLSPASAAIVEGVPGMPQLASAAPGNGSATVRWIAGPANGSPISGYVITPYIGLTAQPAQTFATNATSDVLTGLTNGSKYTFKIVAQNSFGNSAPSSLTAAIAVGSPAAPGAPTAVAGAGQATVSWHAPGNNGSAITGYVVTPYIAGVAQTPVTFNSTALSEVITGLTSGTAYTFKVAAINADGTGPQSLASASVTPS